jgi:hypothetical protein
LMVTGSAAFDLVTGNTLGAALSSSNTPVQEWHQTFTRSILTE